MSGQIRSLLSSSTGSLRLRAKRNYQFIGFTSEDEQVHVSQEVGEIFMGFIIGQLFGVVAAAIQGTVDCEDHISHWIVLTPVLRARGHESLMNSLPCRVLPRGAGSLSVCSIPGFRND